MIIYKTTNLINSKIYIGKACGKNVTNNYLGSGKHIKASINKYGKENFKRVTIDKSETHKELCLKEIFWIDFYDAKNPKVGYNITIGGEGGQDIEGEKNPWYGISRFGKNNPFFGKKHSEETKKKIREKALGKLHSKETKKKMSISKIGEKNSMYGKHFVHSKETRAKLSESHKGKIHTDETRQKMSVALSGENHPMYGKKYTEETKTKMRKPHKISEVQLNG